MKIAMSSYSASGAWFVLRLLAEGHKVDYFLSKPKYADILSGIIPPPIIKTLDHRYNLESQDGFPDYSKYDLSLFDLTGRGRQADFSHSQTPTIGDGSIHCELEDNRLFGIEIMEDSGINVPEYKTFSDVASAKAHIRKTGKRFVFKPNGNEQDTASTYVAKSPEDMLEYIDKLFELSKGTPFLLQEFKTGIEISTEGWFDGTSFHLLNCTLEEKKFMNGNVGPNTGCSGNLLFTINSDDKIYTEGLAKIAPFLASVGFRGMIDLNTIVTETEIYGLEWTPRFGYDSTATLACMYGGNWGDLLARIARGETPEENWLADFGASVRLSIPPYPTEIRHKKLQGVPIKGLDIENEEQMLKTFCYDILADDAGNLVCAGLCGFLLAPVEVGNSSPEAFDKLEDTIKRFEIPDMQYRTDIKSSVQRRYYELQKQGWI